MGGRSLLKNKKPRLLGYHGGSEGRQYHQAFADLERHYGPFHDDHVRFMAGRAAMAQIQLAHWTAELAAAQRKRRCGRGRRPSERQVERLARRHGLADSTYAAAIQRLEELARHQSGDDLLADLLNQGSPT